MTRKWFFCATCIWFDDEHELCNHEPDPIPTVAGRQCSLFHCVCGGDYEDMADHTDCFEIEVSLDN